MRNIGSKVLFGTALALVAGVASATPAVSFDADVATTALGTMGGVLGLVGAAKIAPAVIAVGWKWIKASIFG